jgi:4'-phosphopantetheinyl transferase
VARQRLAKHIELWLVDVRGEDIERCSLILDDAELSRAQRYKIDRVRHRFIVARATLRRVLARYLAIKVEHVVFTLGEYGKPFLSSQLEHQGLVFNLSHSVDMLAIVVGSNQQLGVDIERHKSISSLSGLVHKCFSENELDYWQNLPESTKQSAFYDIWTRKEAFVKAVGRGVALGMNQCVTRPENPEKFTGIPEAYGRAADWQIINFVTPKYYSGAIVTNNLHVDLRVFNGLGAC